MSARLSRRHVLVTGAGGGIGLAIAEACLAEGARCTLADLSPKPSPQVARRPALYSPATLNINECRPAQARHRGHRLLRRQKPQYVS